MPDFAALRLWYRGFGGCAALLGIGLGACTRADADADAPRSPSGCPLLQEAEPLTIEADVRVLATEQNQEIRLSPLQSQLITDGDEVYWYDDSGSVFVERQGEATIEALPEDPRAPASLHPAVTSIVADAERLYVGSAFRDHGSDEISDFEPPGRLLSLSKQAGQVEVLLEDVAHPITPIAVDSERVIVFLGRRDAGFYQLHLADRRLERLPLSAPFEGSQLVGGSVYWLNDADPRSLLRSGFDDAEPESVLQMADRDDFFALGPNYILSREARVLSGYRYVGKDFVLHDDSACRALPATHGGILVDELLDAHHAYWYAAWNTTPTTPDEFRLARVDVESGAVTRMNTPGFTAHADVRIVGQDDTRVFLRSGSMLVAVQKP